MPQNPIFSSVSSLSNTIKTEVSSYFSEVKSFFNPEQQFRVNPPGYTYNTSNALTKNVGNISPGSIFLNASRNALSGLSSGLGNSITSAVTQPFISTLFSISQLDGVRNENPENLGQPYSIIPYSRLTELINWPTKYKDTRSFKGYVFSVNNVRLDGASAATRKGSNNKTSKFAAAYAAASAAPGGAYTVFNLETLYGWGNHGDPNALRRDFTARSNVATRWDPINNKWVGTSDPIELATEFRGDKITVIDYSKRKLSNVYKWNPRNRIFNDAKINEFLDKNDLTKDFIKFYFTGPKLQNGLSNEEDDIMVFRAIIDTFSDTHSPGWTPVTMIGRADPNYLYTGYSREVSLSFTVYATSRDEMKPIYRKLNALASYTAPEYSKETIALKSPWLRMTIGDLLVQQPVIINSLTYTFQDADTTWEINIENDPTMMQAPHKVSVSLGLNVLTDYLPQKNGKMYTLAKQFNEQAEPLPGPDNWLSDFDRKDINTAYRDWKAAQQQTRKSRTIGGEPDPSESGTVDIETLNKIAENSIQNFNTTLIT